MNLNIFSLCVVGVFHIIFSTSQIFNNLKENSVILFSTVTTYLPDLPHFSRRYHLGSANYVSMHFGVVRSHTAGGIQAEVRWALHIIQVVCTERVRVGLCDLKGLLMILWLYRAGLWDLRCCPWC